MSFGSNRGTGSSVASSSSRAARGVSSRIDRGEDDDARGSLDGVGGPGRWVGRALPPSAPDPLRTVPVRNSGGRRSLYTGPGSCAPVLRRDGGDGGERGGQSVELDRGVLLSLDLFVVVVAGRGEVRGARGGCANSRDATARSPARPLHAMNGIARWPAATLGALAAPREDAGLTL